MEFLVTTLGALLVLASSTLFDVSLSSIWEYVAQTFVILRNLHLWHALTQQCTQKGHFDMLLLFL